MERAAEQIEKLSSLLVAADLTLEEFVRYICEAPRGPEIYNSLNADLSTDVVVGWARAGLVL